MRCLLLEQHYKLGGLATWFKRPSGQIFDISLHGFPVGMIKSCRRYWTAEIADRIVQLKHIRFDNPMFSLTTAYTREDFTRLLCERFGVAPATVQEFFDATRSMNFYDDQATTTGQLFERFFPGRQDVVRLLMEPIVYANGSTLEDPAITYGIVFSNFMSKGVFIFEGGTDHLIQLMHDELVRNGVDVRIRCDVERIVVEQGRVAGVQVNGRTIKCRAVVSNANLKSTILRNGRRAALRSPVPGRRQGRAVEQLQHASLHGAPGRRLDRRIHGRFAVQFDRPRIPHGPAAEPRHHQPDLFVLLPAHAAGRPAALFRGVQHQRPLRGLGRADAGRLRSEQARLDRNHAGLPWKSTSRIAASGSSTPRRRRRSTFQHYTKHVAGASFGTKFEGLAVSRGLPEQVGGLYHAGSVGIIMSGWLGAINYGVIVANNVDGELTKVERCTA